jgi:hypothetical protein
VLWEDPLAVGPGAWVERLEPLMKRPSKWAMVYEANTARTAYNIRTQLVNGRYRIPDGTWQFKARKSGKGGKVYACYVGPKNEPAVGSAG